MPTTVNIHGIEVQIPDPEIQGEGTVSEPPNRATQIEKLQTELRKVRALQKQVAERRANLEASLTRLLGERDAEQLLEKMSPAQREAMKRLAAG